ncbi:MAG: uracil-DNA glycosylase [Myxococcales bacterium]|nr:uracil-DNA glycosylase [Myxococcales bacterium]MCB9708655.1 uracil-DNA glycosylase [Myxococcales bacterium]
MPESPIQPRLKYLIEGCTAHWQREASLHRPNTPVFIPVAELPAISPTANAAPLDRERALRLLADEISNCQRCALSASRTRTVFARGNPNAALVFVGEGPGYHEDQQGVPFVGAAGQLLDRMIQAMRYRPEDVYICNVVKCRPPENRTPLSDEVAACSGFLEAQLGMVQPRVIVALGKCAAQALCPDTSETRRWRGAWSEWRGIDVMSTYHPAFLLRSPDQKKTVWADLQQVMRKLGGQ